MSPINRAVSLQDQVIDEGSDDEQFTSDESSIASSDGGDESDNDGPMVSMMDMKIQAEKEAKDQRDKIIGGITPPPGNRKTLLAQFEDTFDPEIHKKGGVRRTILANKGGGNLVSDLKPLQIPSLTPQGSEHAEANGMVAGRKKRNALNRQLSVGEREVIEKQKQLLLNAPKKLVIHPKAKALRIFSSLIDVFQRVWLRSRHLALILKYFSIGAICRTADFGSYRVEVVVVLFCRVVDVQNFDLVWEQLNTQEIACIHCRLGMLNFFNPLKLEGCYSLDISRYEERVIAKMLAVLSTVEAGENWINETFRWEYFAECIPGWELTRSWLRDENMPHRGYLYLEYYSGGCTKFGVPLLRHGCNPDIGIRKSLLAMVYLSEDMIIDDECNRDAKGVKYHKKAAQMSSDGQRVKSECVGVISMRDHMEHWNALLAPARSTSALIAGGEATEKVFKKLKYTTMNIVKHLPSYQNVYFGAGDTVIDKTSEKGKKLMARMQERLLRRGKELEEAPPTGGQETQATNKTAGRKKKMDLSVDPPSTLMTKVKPAAKIPAVQPPRAQNNPVVKKLAAAQNNPAANTKPAVQNNPITKPAQFQRSKTIEHQDSMDSTKPRERRSAVRIMKR
jgi:hypothetical protein